jgi:hypothetical protein
LENHDQPRANGIIYSRWSGSEYSQERRGEVAVGDQSGLSKHGLEDILKAKWKYEDMWEERDCDDWKM